MNLGVFSGHVWLCVCIHVGAHESWKPEDNFEHCSSGTSILYHFVFKSEFLAGLELSS